MNRYINLITLVLLILILTQTGYTLQTNIPTAMSSGTQLLKNQYSVETTDSLIQSLIDQTNLDTLAHFVNILSGEDSVTINDCTYLLLSRNPIHPHNDLAADFIFQTLNHYGLQTINQKYSTTGRNIYGIKAGITYPDQKFIICAHYDCSPAQPPAPGADDNASGVAATLEAARILSQIPTPYTIIFAFWDEEEIGMFGSLYFTRQAYESGEDIQGVIDLEMFGWDNNDDGLIDIHTRPIAESVALAKLVKDLAIHHNLGLVPVIYNPGTAASDHGSFWKYGYSALVFSEAFSGGDFNPFYQKSGDRIIHFNMDYFHRLSRLAVATISHLALETPATHVEKNSVKLLSDFTLYQNYPNPFNPKTIIPYTVGAIHELPLHIDLSIYNILGKKMCTLVSETQKAGNYQVEWDASGFASGVYLYKLTTDNGYENIKKLVLLK